MNDNNADLIKRTIRKVYETMRVAMPAIIESYDPLTSLATVKISIPHIRDNEEELDVPIISAVPVLWQRAGGASITFPLQRGDWGLVIHCDGDIGKWATELDAGKPQSKRRHAWTDAVFLPQTHGLQASNPIGLELKYGSNTVTLTEAGINIVGNTTITGNLAVTGTTTMQGILFNTHVHGGVQTGAGNTGTPQ